MRGVVVAIPLRHQSDAAFFCSSRFGQLRPICYTALFFRGWETARAIARHRSLFAAFLMALFEGCDLACMRGGRMVFAGLRFALPAGGALILTGPNGSGKSSLLRLMAGLLRPFAGRLLWQGVPIEEDADAHRARLAFLGHLDALKAVLSARENLAFWASLYGAGPDRVDSALAHFGLEGQASVAVRLLSAGQRRRLALARLQAVQADLWLLDEPTVALDRSSVAALEAALAAHRSAGGRVAVATHQALDLPNAEMLSLGDFPAADMMLEYVW